MKLNQPNPDFCGECWKQNLCWKKVLFHFWSERKKKELKLCCPIFIRTIHPFCRLGVICALFFGGVWVCVCVCVHVSKYGCVWDWPWVVHDKVREWNRENERKIQREEKCVRSRLEERKLCKRDLRTIVSLTHSHTHTYAKTYTHTHSHHHTLISHFKCTSPPHRFSKKKVVECNPETERDTERQNVAELMWVCEWWWMRVRVCACVCVCVCVWAYALGDGSFTHIHSESKMVRMDEVELVWLYLNHCKTRFLYTSGLLCPKGNSQWPILHKCNYYLFKC